MVFFKLKENNEAVFCIMQKMFTNEEKGSEGTNS